MNNQEGLFSLIMNNSNKIMRLLKEPMLHFLLIGAVLFLVHGWRNTPGPVPVGQAVTPILQITVTRENIDQMNSLFVKTWQRQPTEEEQKRLMEDFVRNEIFYREAIAIGLDRNDEVLKRRLRQKMEFIYEDIGSLAEPADEELKAFMEKHQENYFADPRIAFRQVYLNPDRRGPAIEADARQILAQLRAGGNPDTVGDATLLEPEIPLSPLWDIRKQFGDEFGKRLLELQTGEWTGPIRSGFGRHLIFISERSGTRLSDLDEVREVVHRDWMVEKQRELKDAAYAKIRERYSVIVERPKTVVAEASRRTMPR